MPDRHTAIERAAREVICRIERVLGDLAGWDMLTLNADGRGAATADAPWARSAIREAQEALRRLAAALATEAPSPEPETIVENIWDHWDAHLSDWDLEGSIANTEAKEQAVLSVRRTLGIPPTPSPEPHGCIPQCREDGCQDPSNPDCMLRPAPEPITDDDLNRVRYLTVSDPKARDEAWPGILRRLEIAERDLKATRAAFEAKTRRTASMSDTEET